MGWSGAMARLAVAAGSCFLLISPESAAGLAARAHRVAGYYSALSAAETQSGPWARLLLSLAMTSNSTAHAAGAAEDATNRPPATSLLEPRPSSRLQPSWPEPLAPASQSTAPSPPRR